ncbi:MAG: DUF2752 domain-containing protein [Pontiellaceae bacterium]|nr:DUF2752 domain-containing protein [Pontiellaceae bacterium]
MRSIGIRLASVVLLGAAAVFIWQMPPEKNALIPSCPVLRYTGFHCSGCGSLRAIHSLLHGDLGRAWTMNPLTVLLIPVLSVLFFDDVIRGRRTLSLRIRPRYLWLLLGTFIVFGILRNLPFFPFTCLTPH